jgi:hypothetical protein
VQALAAVAQVCVKSLLLVGAGTHVPLHGAHQEATMKCDQDLCMPPQPWSPLYYL